MRWLIVSVLVIAGCSAPEQQPPAPPPPPPPEPATRVLVAWADKMCVQVKALDTMRSELGKAQDGNFSPESGMPSTQLDGYVSSAATALGRVTSVVKELPSSGIQAVDAHVTSLLKQLDGARAQVPQADTAFRDMPYADKVTKIKQMAAAFTAVEPQVPKLAGLAESTRELVSSYNVAPGCEPVKQHDERARKLLAWTNVMCATTKSLLAIDTAPMDSPVFTDPRFGRVVGIELSMYINNAADPLKEAVGKLSALQPTGITTADDYRAEVLAAVQAALPKLPERDPGSSMISQLPDEELKRQATQVAQTLETAKPKQQPDFGNPDLSIAATLAPECEPPKGTTTMPTASNGTDVSACASGKCQIQVTGSADVAMKGFKFKITVTSSGVSVAHDTGLLKLGSQGEGSFGNPGGSVSFKLAGLQDTTAVVDITAS